MPYVPGFESDIFISYSHLDNQALTGETPMISSLHRDLELRVGQWLGNAVAMWRDTRLQGNDYFDETIERQLTRIAVIVSIMSPRYCGSEWCVRELKGFLRAAEETGGVRIGTKSRLFKAVKTRVDLGAQPEEVRNLLGYEFFRVDDATGRPREFQIEGTPEAEVAYRRKLDDLAYDIHLILKQMRERAEGPPSSELDSLDATTIYLAETTSDLKETRDELRREFLARGYRVLPEVPLLLEADAIMPELRKFLEKADLSIHLIGNRYGLIPEGEARSIVWLQNEAAVEQQGKSNLKRILWLAPNLAPSDDRHRAAIADLRSGKGLSGLELLENSTVEALKSLAIDKLTERPQPPSPTLGAAEGEPTRLYVVCEARDFDAIRPIKKSLQAIGLEVTLPLREGDQAEIRADHEEQLQFCDGILIYYGAGSERWLREKQNDLKRARALGRQKPFLARGIYLGPNPTDDKADFSSNEFVVVRSFTEFNPDVIRPFIEKLVPGQGSVS